MNEIISTLWKQYPAFLLSGAFSLLAGINAAYGQTKLNSALPMGGDVSQFLISTDNSRVVYRADQDTDEVFELYSVPLTGGTVTKLNNPMVSGGDIYFNNFLISPDNSTVVYIADQDTDGVAELYSVPIGGGTVTKLNDPLVNGGQVSFPFSISPDNSTVVYTADQDTDNEIELYSVPLGGGTVTKLNDPLVNGGDVFTIKISPNSNRVIYLADQDTDNVFELYSVPIGGGTVTKLNGTLASLANVSGFYLISPDNSKVLYMAKEGTGSHLEPDLYSVPIAGGTSTKLNDPLVSGGRVALFEISANSTTAVYMADQDTDNMEEIYSVPIGGGTVTKLNGPIVANGEVESFTISTDNNRVVYIAEQETDETNELYSVPIGGGTVTKLNDPLVTNGDVFDFQISSDNSTVVYSADQDIENVIELYSVAIAGGTVNKLNDPLSGQKDVVNYLIANDNTTVVFWSDKDINDVLEVFKVPLGGGTNSKLHPNLPVGRAISEYQLSSNSMTLVYRGDQDTDNVVELYSNSLILPVELTSFKAKATRDGNLLTWQTASEFNNEGFEIQWAAGSDKVINWQTLDFLNGAGTSFEKQFYSFLHENPSSGLNYYRLKQIDYDGLFEYSEIVSLDLLNSGDALSLWVAPNPVNNGAFTLYLPENQTGLEENAEIPIQLYDSVGRLSYSTMISENETRIEVEDLPNGLYFLYFKLFEQPIVEKMLIKN